MRFSASTQVRAGQNVTMFENRQSSSSFVVVVVAAGV
jgi:hypothetical protein